MVKYCSKCGARALPGARFCRSCGNKLEKNTADSDDQVEIQQEDISPSPQGEGIGEGFPPWIAPLLTSPLTGRGIQSFRISLR